MTLSVEIWSLPRPGQPDNRLAVPILDTVPAGCIRHRMKTDTHAPRLRRGDQAVVDPNNRTFTDGALYLIDFTGQTRTIAPPPGHQGPPILVSDRWGGNMVVGTLHSGDSPPPQLTAMIHGRVVGVLRQPDNR